MYAPRPVPRTTGRARTRGSGAEASGTKAGRRSLPTAQRITSRPARTSLSIATSIFSSRRATASTRSTAPPGSPRPHSGGAPAACSDPLSGVPQRGHSSPLTAYVRSPHCGQVWYGIAPELRSAREPSATAGRDASPRSGRGEGDLGRVHALALEQPPLRLGAPRERPEIDAGQPRVLARDVLERAPQRALALDAEREELELEHAAVRRVAGDPP